MRNSLLLLLASSFWLLASSLALGQGTAGPVAGGTNYQALQIAFAQPGVSWAATGLTLTYASGTVYPGATAQAITGATLSLTDTKATCTVAAIQAGTDACNYVYWSSSTALSNTVTYSTATAPGKVLMYLCTTTGGNITGCVPDAQLPQLPIGSLTYHYFCGATTGTTTCPNTASGGTARVIGGIATLASNTAVISAIAPAFTSTSTFSCVGNDVTTRANPVQVVQTSTSSITITNTTGASDVINWVCIGY